jgi:hypothetical protein
MLQLQNLEGEYELLLHNASGQLIHREMLNIENSIELKELNVSQFSAGLYFCTLVSDKKFITQKLVKL